MATFEQIRSRHAPSVEALADIKISMRHYEQILKVPLINEHIFELFLKERLGIQLLCDHYVSFNKGKSHGGVSIDCDLGDILTDAIQESKHICDANFGMVPDVEVVHVDTEQNHSATLIRPWVHHSFVELLKNAMTSSIQRNFSFPPNIYIKIERQCLEDSIICKIFDQGIGLDDIQEAFKFASSSAQIRWDRMNEQQSYASVRPPIASLGVGLTLSTLMMRIFGGDINLVKRSAGFNITTPNGDIRRLDSGVTAIITIPLSNDIKEWSRLQ